MSGAAALGGSGRGEGGDLALWTGVLAGPAAFALDEAVSYSLAPTACAAGAKLPLHLVAIAALALALAGCAAAWRAWRRTGGGERGEPASREAGPVPGRRRFMALSGLALSAGCALVVVALEIPNLVLPLRACR